MKKIFKKFASTAFVCASLFAGVNSIENEKIQSNQNNETIQIEEQNVRNNGKVFFLQPGSGFNPNDSIYNGYWNNMEIVLNGTYHWNASSAWMLAIESVESVGDNYKIDFYYSFYQNWGSSYYQVNLNIFNYFNSWGQTFNLGEIFSSSNGSRVSSLASIEVPKVALQNENSLIFDIEFVWTPNPIYYLKVINDSNPVFSLKNYPYLNDFYINSFSLVNNSTTTDGFEFVIDARDASTDNSIKNPTSLTLYSNGMPLNTEFEGYQGSLLKYKVSGLMSNSIYTKFTVAINGYSGFLPIENFAINTKPSGINPNAGVIAGSTIGGLVLLLLIILLVIYLIKRSNKVEEHNVYNEYITYEDENGEQVQVTKEEYEDKYENYSTPQEPESEYLNGNYNFVKNENSHEEDPGFY